MKINRFLTFSLLGLACLPCPVFGQDDPLWQPETDITVRHGDDRTAAVASIMAPVAQTDRTMAFIDVRTLISERGVWEGNAGAGVRTITPFNAILGTYVFLDKRQTEFDNQFHQVTAGVEAIGTSWDARINVYEPLGEQTKRTSGSSLNARLSGTQLFLQDGQTYESALAGWDIEAGHALPGLDNIRLYGSHYRFRGQDLEDIKGYKARLSADVTDWLRVGAEYRFQNSVQDNALFGEVRLRFPIGGPGSSSKRLEHASALQKRMMEPVVRDVDIVTRAQEPAAFVAALTPNGQTSDVYFVDNTAPGGGNGSQASPFNTLAAAQAAAGDYDTIYVLRGTGTTIGQNAGITMNRVGQRLLGSGVDLTIDPTRLQSSQAGSDSSVLLAAGVAPVITNAAGTGITVTANTVEIAGLTVSGSTNSNISVTNADDVVIRNMTVQSATANGGILAQYNNGGNYDLSVLNSTLGGNTGSGLNVQATAASIVRATATGNTANANTLRGIHMRAANTANLTGSISGNTTNTNGSYGIYFETIDNTVNATTIASNTSNGNLNNNGIYVVGLNNAVTAANILNNIANSTVGNGLLYQARGAAQVSGTISGNTFGSNSANGLYIQARDTGIVTATITGNTSTGNTSAGAFLQIQNGGQVIATATGNSTTTNGVGLYMLDQGAGSVNAGFSGNNRSFGNTTFDLQLDLDGAQQSAENNWWGNAAGLLPGRVNLVDGTVDATPYLTTDPGP